jgi:hypothetical protein
MVTVAATTASFDTNVFSDLSKLVDFQATVPEVRADDPRAGQNIGIQIESTTSPELIGGVWDLDNVRLVESVATSLANFGLTSDGFSFTLQSEPGLAFEILGANRFGQPGAGWTNLASITNVTGVFSFTDTTTNLSQRFYQARQLP